MTIQLIKCTFKTIFRDLKPTNILIKIPGCSQSYNPRLNWKEMDIDTLVVKVADFGHSRHVPNKDVDQTLTGNVGTPRYRAPEVNTDVPEKYGEKADIYSIGLIALKMLGREQYGDGEDTGDAKGDPKVGDSLPASTSDAAKDFVSKILDVKNAMDRPSARRLLAHKFITDPDRKLTVALDSAIQSIACTKSHVVVLFEDGTVCLVDSHTKTADKRLTAIINSEVLLPNHKEVFALASYENSFALATSEDTVKIWTIAEDGTSVKRVEPEMKFRNDKKDDKITWLGLSELHVIALFKEGSMRALSLENPRFKELRIKNSAFENPLHFDLDNKQPSRSYITTVIEGGKKIQQSSIRDKNRDRRVVQSPITRVVDLQTVVSCIAWGDQIDDDEEEKSLPEEEEKSQSEEDDELETNAEHTFVYLSYGRSVVLLDLQDGKVLREVSLPSGQEVSYISFGMGVLFSVVAKGKDRWIIAFEQSDIQEVDPNYYTYTMLSATKEPSPFRVIAKFESAAAAAPNPRAQGVESFDKQWPLVVSDTEVVFAVEGKLHFLDKTGIMVKRKVYKLD